MRNVTLYAALCGFFLLPSISFAESKPELKALVAIWAGTTSSGESSLSKIYITNVACKDAELLDELKDAKALTSIMIDEQRHNYIIGCYSHSLGNKKIAHPDVDDKILLRWYNSPNEKTWELPADLFLQPKSFGQLPEILDPKSKLHAEGREL